MSATSKAATLQKAFQAGGWAEVFVGHLGWENPKGAVPGIRVDNDIYQPELLASLKGFHIYRVPCHDRPTRQLMRKIDATFADLTPERMEIFEAPESWFWHWPRRTNAGTTSFDSVETAPGTLPTFLAQRLTGLEFTIADHRNGLTLADVRARVHGHFDATNVTTKFYKRFQSEHVSLAESVTGVPGDQRFEYATTLLNRLMFLYFMQKKEFLNGDSRYLENTLAAVKKLQGPNQYHSFYRDALLPLFFNRLNEGCVVEDPGVATILGDVPYINGGVFGRTDLEIAYADDLAVPDSAFESILNFFAEFNWHLDTRPTGNPDEINPEVIGYIFEQYINFAASGKKDNGAYYTPHDVTAHMVSQTLIPRVFDDFTGRETAFEVLREDPDRYIQPAMLHGWDALSNTWAEAPIELVKCWRGDPIGWTLLDGAERDDAVLLPGETWVEAFHRRSRVESLRKRIAEGNVASVNDLVTDNLNGQLLLTDVIDRLDDGAQIAGLFKQVTSLSVFDPTCGSGAFLFAALEVMEDIYDHIIDAARAVAGNSAATELLRHVDKYPSKRYFIRKHIAIRNLYGTDLMPGAIETAKLRIFLSLAACVETRAELQPLPDLDFNLKAGNLVVGFKDADDITRIGADLLTSVRLEALKPKIDEYADLYAKFADTVESDHAGIHALKVQLRERESDLRKECNAIYADVGRISEAKLEEWIETSRPFHWFCEFPEVIRNGGFDVVIGNPPYVRMTQLPGYNVVGYATNKCPDLYAICFERSLSLTSPRGRHAFIVMLNLAFSDSFASLRKVVADREGAEWWSTYGKRPDSLFRGVQVRNTVLVQGPGAGKFSTRHTVFGRVDRAHMFQTAEFYPFDRAGGQPPLRGGIANGLLNALKALPAVARPPSGEKLYLRPTGQYWFPALFALPPVLDKNGAVLEQQDHSVKHLRLLEKEDRLCVGAVLAGKISYAWWSAVGDDFHVNPDEADGPRRLTHAVQASPELISLAARVRDRGREAAFVSRNNDGYINVRWNAVRNTTDVFDLALLEVAGLGGHWRDLNVWYRQCMRSSGVNNNSRLLTPAEAESFLR